MTAKLLFYFILPACLYANNIATSSENDFNSTLPTSQNVSDPYDINTELDKIGCMGYQDLEKLFNGTVKHGLAYSVAPTIIRLSFWHIGLEELRKSLGYAPAGRWTHYNETNWELSRHAEDAPTPEEYLARKFPQTRIESLDSQLYFEENFLVAYDILDNHFPSIRYIFTHEFDRMVKPYNGKIDKAEINEILGKWRKLRIKLKEAIDKMFAERCVEQFPTLLF